MDTSSVQFPKSFLWGAATSAHQVEGGLQNDWTEWEQSPQRLHDLRVSGKVKEHGLENYISGVACDHYHRFLEDFTLAKKLGHNATRFSIEWSRIEPEESKFNEEALQHYQEVVHIARENGLEPFVTLWHWPIPVWLRDTGGWKSQKIVDYFSRYVEKVVSFIGEDVRFWITLNELEIYAAHSYLKGIWPPQQKNSIGYLRVLHHLISAHREAYGVIKKIHPEAQIGIAKNNVYFEAYKNKFVNKIIKWGAD